jgi:hypothetical protein
MSEDVLTLRCVAPSTAKGTRQALIEAVEVIAREFEPQADVDAGWKGKHARLVIENASFDKAVIERMLGALEALGASKAHAEAWLESVGEELVYARTDDALHVFQSIEELELERKRLAEKARAVAAPLAFDYGKAGVAETALLRLTVQAKGKRARLAEAFRTALPRTPEAAEAFQAAILPLFSSKDHHFEWCRFRWADGDKWTHGPADLIRGLVFVEERESDLYLGFDLAGLDLIDPDAWNPMAEFEWLLFIARHLNGVRKAWVKVRYDWRVEEEAYGYWPLPTDEPVLSTRPLSDDADWPPM